VAGPLLEGLGVGSLHHHVIELDLRDAQDRDGGAGNVHGSRRSLGGGRRCDPLLEPGPEIVLRRSRGEAGPPQDPPDVAADGETREDQDETGDPKDAASPPPAVLGQIATIRDGLLVPGRGVGHDAEFRRFRSIPMRLRGRWPAVG
jgi:hypothetical protein